MTNLRTLTFDPAKWRLVPPSLTEEMRIAWRDADKSSYYCKTMLAHYDELKGKITEDNFQEYVDKGLLLEFNLRFQALLAAAPEPPGSLVSASELIEATAKAACMIAPAQIAESDPEPAAGVSELIAERDEMRAKLDRVDKVLCEYEGLTGVGYQYIAGHIRDAIAARGK